jgi:hypothetical protein
LDSREKAVVCDTEEEAEFKAHHGTQFTVERFLAWKEKFDKEMEEKEEKEAKEKLDPDREERITGRKFFEMRAALHVVSSGDEAEAAPAAALAADKSKCKRFAFEFSSSHFFAFQLFNGTTSHCTKMKIFQMNNNIFPAFYWVTKDRVCFFFFIT